MNSKNNLRRLAAALIISLTLAGCFHHEPVRHFASDACLLLPAKTTREQTVAMLGDPAERRVLPGGDEEWLYYQVNKSLLRRTPYIGDKLGSEKYDVLTVTFSKGLVRACSYRIIDEADFKQKGDNP